MAEGKEYRSTRAAAKALGIWRAEIKRRLSNPSKEDWYYWLDKQQSFGCSPVFAKKDEGPSVCFPSLQACVDAGGFASNTLNLQRKIKRKADGFRYAHFDPKTGKHLRTPYTLQDGDMLYIPEYPNCLPYTSSSSSSPTLD